MYVPNRFLRRMTGRQFKTRPSGRQLYGKQKSARSLVNCCAYEKVLAHEETFWQAYHRRRRLTYPRPSNFLSPLPLLWSPQKNGFTKPSGFHFDSPWTATTLGHVATKRPCGHASPTPQCCLPRDAALSECGKPTWMGQFGAYSAGRGL